MISLLRKLFRIDLEENSREVDKVQREQRIIAARISRLQREVTLINKSRNQGIK